MTDEIRTSEEYRAYIKALSRLASKYVSDIRELLARQAFEKFQDASIRRLVLEYGKEVDALDRQRLRDFTYYAEFATEGGALVGHLEDSILNRASQYEEAIKLLFGVFDRNK